MIIDKRIPRPRIARGPAQPVAIDVRPETGDLGAPPMMTGGSPPPTMPRPAAPKKGQKKR